MALSRRVMLSVLAAAAASPFDFLAASPETPNMIMGPFYPQVKPLDRDADLTRVEGRKGAADGEVVDVAGRVLTRHGEPLRGVRIEVWQANAHGRYAHDADPYTKVPLDPNFQGYAVLTTDAAGRYRFRTIKPGAYPSLNDTWRAPHIHFDVQAHVDRKVTQMFFPGEKLNEQDYLLGTVRRNREVLVAKRLAPALLEWDIVLSVG